MTFCLRSLSVVLMSAVVAGCNAGAPPPANDDASYAVRLQAARAAIDAAFRNQPNEPVPPNLMDKLVPLSYFPPDLAFVVPASLELADERVVVDMPTSTGEMRKEERVGVLEFTLKGQLLTLGAFIEAGSPDVNKLFVPFSDLTSGAETLRPGATWSSSEPRPASRHVDFNRAFNPYCYYNPKFDCLVSPQRRIGCLCLSEQVSAFLRCSRRSCSILTVSSQTANRCTCAPTRPCWDRTALT